MPAFAFLFGPPSLFTHSAICSPSFLYAADARQAYMTSLASDGDQDTPKRWYTNLDPAPACSALRGRVCEMRTHGTGMDAPHIYRISWCCRQAQSRPVNLSWRWLAGWLELCRDTSESFTERKGGYLILYTPAVRLLMARLIPDRILRHVNIMFIPFAIDLRLRKA